MKIEELNELYRNSEQVDKPVFSEMRSNLQLVDGSHFKKAQEVLYGSRNINHSQTPKLRLTKNHIQVVTKEYENSISKLAPWVRPIPHNENEMQDQKAAKLANDIWLSAKHKHNLKAKIRDWISDFVDLGEVHTKITWNPSLGKIIGYKQALDPEGSPIFTDLTGADTLEPVNVYGVPNEPKAGKEAIREGDIEIETIPGFNLMRDPQSESLEDSPYLIVRKMKQIKDLKTMLGDDKEKIALLNENAEESFQVFDSNTKDFETSKGKILVREFYYRPCTEYPEGYFYITVEGGVLWEGELPFGLFPIVSEEFEKIQGSCRGKSIIRPLRAPQAEINRTASHIAQTQITVGYTRVFVQNGTKVSKNIQLPGMQVYNYTGATPITQDGKSGEQFFSYLESQVSELYRLANLSEIIQGSEKSLDPHQSLFASMRYKKKFSLYAEKFEEFLVNVCKLYLKTAQKYYDEDRVIMAVGRRERVNITEFKDLEDFDYAIKLEPVSEDIDSLLGKMQNIQAVLQYVGKDLPQDTIGRLIRALPFVNQDEFFDELTIDDDNITNDLLALDRGELPELNKYDNNAKYIKRLIHRIKQADFRYLAPEVQQNYMVLLKQHEGEESRKAKELQEAQAGFIPTGGGIVKVDAYETVTNSEGKPTQRRMMFPVEAVQWLKGKLETQGSTQNSLAQVNDQSLIEMAQMLDGGQMAQGGQQMPSLPQAM